ncbi:type VII secretion protein EccE [Actinocatenispora rupis]|nr:type VII secretion protein EccE [Actinocatenispora rupis]
MTPTTPTMDDRLAGGTAGPAVPPLRALPGGRRRRTGPLLAQLVVVEVAAFAVAVAVGRVAWLLPVVAAVAVAVTALLLGRWRGRWWYQQIPLRWRFRRWGGTARQGEPRRAALRELAPELRVVDVTERDATFGLAYDGEGWFAAVAVDGGDALPLRELSALVDGGLSTLQVVTRVAPAPTPRLTTWAPAAQSYQDVGARLAGQVPPALAGTYVCVRLDVVDAVDAAASRGGGPAGVRRALAAALRRVGRTLSTSDVPHRTLGADELLAVLTSTLGLGPLAAGGRRTAQTWDRFTADGYAQVSYQVTGWPPRGGRTGALLSAGPAAWTTVALVLGPRTDLVGPAEVPLRGYVRLGAPPDALAAATEALAHSAELHGITVRRLDGEQGPAAYATVPTGGSPAVGTAAHACPVGALDALAPPVPRGGVLLGRDPDQKPVLVDVFRHRPTRLVLVGGIWPTRLVLLRCLAVGARVVSSPGQPDWVSLGRWATGVDHCVLPPATVLPPHPAAPVLVSVDPTGMAPPPVAWQTTAVTCTRPTAALLAGTDLVVTGKLLPADAQLVAGTYGLSAESTNLLSRMYDDMVAVVEPGSVRFAWPTPTPVEREVLTPPRQERPALGRPPR